MSLPKPSSDATVVVTGASSGIGTELARGLAQRGYPLVLVARRRERLDELADELRSSHTVAVDVMPLDLGDASARQELSDKISRDTTAGLCNSAGFGTSGPFHTLPIERECEQVTLNALALMELTHAALPGMVERGAGAVLNIASIAGFQPLPRMAIYSATKAFVQTFSEAVHEELHGTGVSCTVLCPGPVPTEWAEIAAAERFSVGIAQVSPHDVAEAAIDGMIDLCGPIDHVFAQSFRRAAPIDADDTTSILLRMKEGPSGYLGTMTTTGQSTTTPMSASAGLSHSNGARRRRAAGIGVFLLGVGPRGTRRGDAGSREEIDQPNYLSWPTWWR